MGDLFPVTHSYLIPLLPLLAAGLVALLGARVLKGQSHWPIWLGVGTSAVLSLWLLIGMLGMSPSGPKAIYLAENPRTWTDVFPLASGQHFFTWFAAGDFRAEAGFWIDPLTAVMLSVICGIGLLIMIFAAKYMQGERGYWRFFAALGLFIFAMTVLVMADNLVLLFLGWEGVGLASYLLIGFYSDTVAARDAAKKAFIVNRIGDLGLAIGIMLTYLVFGTVSFYGTPQDPGFLRQFVELNATPEKWAALAAWKQSAIHAIPYLLLLGCFGKSAQWPLFTWLPDAMAGPTPVSALIHAATMVTAGVYLVVRSGPVFYAYNDVMVTLGVIACFTAVFAGTISLRQYDLKKDFAYSTVSQLGFMFVAAAALAPVAAIFHLVTHAFFKALLFLGSGVIMHATGGELDMRKMSGLKRHLPLTRILMLIGCAALAGLPLLSGYFSKDEILANSFKHSVLLGAMMLLSAAMTAYYTFRLYFRVFEGELILPASAHGHGHAAHGVSVSKAATARMDDHVDEWEKPHFQPGMSTPPDDAATHDADSSSGHQADAPSGSSHGGSSHGGSHGPKEPLLMMLPLVVLALGALLAGLLNFPERTSYSLGSFLGQSPSLYYGHQMAKLEFGTGEGPERLVTGAAIVPGPAFGQLEEPEAHAHADDAHAHADDAHAHAGEHGGLPHWAMFVVSGVIALAGVGLAYQFHLRNRESLGRLSASLPALVKVLEAKYWVDEIYNALVVKPLRVLARGMDLLDLMINGVVWAVSYVPKLGAFLLSVMTQRGYLQGYAVAMLIGLAVVLLVFFR